MYLALSNTTSLYKTISKDTWERMKFAYKTDLKISETTLTENLLFSMYKFGAKSSVRMYESKDEKTNGNDLEIYIEIENGKYIFLAVQAKRLYIKNKEKYTRISHKVKGKFQIDSLIEYAESKEGIALYLLYNYVPNCTKKSKENFGCTLANADYIKNNYYPISKTKWTIPTFQDLHKNHAVPWHILGDIRFINRCIKNKKLNFYKNNEIIDDGWASIETYKPDKRYADQPDRKSFNPKFKLVFDKNKGDKSL